MEKIPERRLGSMISSKSLFPQLLKDLELQFLGPWCSCLGSSEQSSRPSLLCSRPKLESSQDSLQDLRLQPSCSFALALHLPSRSARGHQLQSHRRRHPDCSGQSKRVFGPPPCSGRSTPAHCDSHVWRTLWSIAPSSLPKAWS